MWASKTENTAWNQQQIHSHINMQMRSTKQGWKCEVARVIRSEEAGKKKERVKAVRENIKANNKSSKTRKWFTALYTWQNFFVLANKKLKVYVSSTFGEACASPGTGQGAPYLHGDVCYGGGGQVKVLLDQNVEFGGQVSPRTDTVNLAGEQRGDLRREVRKMQWEQTANSSFLWFIPCAFISPGVKTMMVAVFPVSTHLFLRPVRHQCVLTLWVDVNQNQVTLLDGH